MKQSSMIKKIILILEFVKTATNFGSADSVLDSHSQAEALDLSYKPNVPDSTVNMGSSHLQAINEPINKEYVEAIKEAFQMYFKETGIKPLYNIDDSALYSILTGLDDAINTSVQSGFPPHDQLAYGKKLYAPTIATFFLHLEKLRINSLEVSLDEKKQKSSDLLYSHIKKSVEAFKTGINDIEVEQANIERVKEKLRQLFKNTKYIAEQRRQNRLTKTNKPDEDGESPPTKKRKKTSNNNNLDEKTTIDLEPLFDDQSIKDFLKETYTKAIEEIEKDFPSDLKSLTPSQAHSFFKVVRKGHSKELEEHKKGILDRTKSFFGPKDPETETFDKTRRRINHLNILELIDKNQEFKKPSENKYLKLIFSYYFKVFTNGSYKRSYANNGIIGDIQNIFCSLFELEEYVISKEFGKHIGILGKSLPYLEIIIYNFDNQKCKNCTRKNTLFCDKCINHLYAELSDFINSEKNPRNLDSIIEKDPFLTNFRDELPEHLKSGYEGILKTLKNYPFLPFHWYFISQLVNLERKKIEVTEKLNESTVLFLYSSLNTKSLIEDTLKLVGIDCPTTRQIVEMLLKGKKEYKIGFEDDFYKILNPLEIKDPRKPKRRKFSHK
ncbi:hypothetical protein GINT2_001917 [Glugoides intestinalis]